MRILIVTDAWFPQVNGVVRTLSTVGKELEALGHAVKFVTPADFRTVPMPTYPEIRLSLNPFGGVARAFEDFKPEAIHIATEGPLGFAARRYCVKRKLPFTSSFHTKFPEYIQARTGLPVGLAYAVVRWFHGAAQRTMVATASLQRELEERGFERMVRWTRGVDLDLFRPRDKDFLDAPRPVYLYVGRIAVEKNIQAFLDLDLDGTKVVVGDGPQLEDCRKRYPAVRFVGAKHGEDLARHYAAADVFVFPSRTDTFGNVMLEALAAGVPVAAFPVTGPNDVINGFGVGCLNEDLAQAARSALEIPGERCRDHAATMSWRACAEQFLGNLAPVATDEPAAT